MGAIPPEMSLDFKPTFIPKTISDLLREVSMIGNVSHKVSKLDGLVKGLEEEMRKIDAFKRELPLCMLLLNDAIAALREESRQCVARNVQPVLEEFMPLKNDHSDKDDDDSISIKKELDSNNTTKDKKNWMSSVQLWNTDESHRPTDRKLETKRNDEAAMLGCKSRGEVGPFMPFKPYSGFASSKEEKVELQNQGLSLLTCGIKNPKEDSGSAGSRNSCSRGLSSAPTAQSSFRSGTQPVQQQASRKQRRCWSPELHRRFVSALQQLGGSQVATPKQIRELLQVDGLTNDEVKSHLQKYRLHTRRVPPGTSSPANQSLVVLGNSMWMSQEQFGDSLKASNSQSGSPQGPLHLATNTGGTSTTGGDSMEDDEDTKSENYSWKSHVNRPGRKMYRAHPL